MARNKQFNTENLEVEENGVLELQKKVAELTRQLEAMLSNKEIAAQNSVDEDDFSNIKIAQDEYIKVVSLCPMQLNLSTQGMGKGKVFRFEKFGEVKRILYSDLVDILEVHSGFVDQGFFYIMDKKVIRKHGLDEVYEKLLTKDQIQKIIDGDQKDSISLFESANDKQREFICDILIEKLQNEEKLDLNLIDRISRIAKVNIIDKAEEAKKYQEIPA